jgi:hypothetical protein
MGLSRASRAAFALISHVYAPEIRKTHPVKGEMYRRASARLEWGTGIQSLLEVEFSRRNDYNKKL